MTGRMEKDPVALNQLHHIEHVAPGLFEGAVVRTDPLVVTSSTSDLVAMIWNVLSGA